MQSYILNILGIVLVSVLVEIILPNGQTAKYIKSIFSIFVVYVLINPILTFIKTDFDISTYLTNDDISINETLLNNLYAEQIEAKCTDIESVLFDKGFENAEVQIVYEIQNNAISILKIKINLDNLVITNTNTNINKYQYIRQVVAQTLEIKEEDVLFE